MRILIDENLPVSLIEALRLLGHDVEHVETRSLSGHDDPDVLALAEREGRFLIMQDVDFADLRSFVAGVHPGLLLVRLKHPAPGDVRAAVLATFESEDVEAWRGCLVVLSDAKLRVRRPE